jgi:ribose-phosphate pyrophosphokinase
LVSNLITNAGANRILSVDLHAGQIQGFFDIPVDNLFSTPIFAKHIKRKLRINNLICVAPDVGGVERARSLGRRINVSIAIIDKRRPAPGKSEVMNIVGNIKNKNCVIVDDIIDTGGTIVNAAKALKDKDAKDIYVYITHAVLSGQAVEQIEKSQIKKLITTDTIDNSKKIRGSKKIEIISMAPIISEAMKRIANSTSVSSLFK